MQDEIKRLQNELIYTYQWYIGKDCGSAPEDSEIIAAYEAATMALEKQIPKKMVPDVDKKMAESGWYRCPVCGSPDYFSFHPKYCEVCGQAFDWTDVPMWIPREEDI